MWLKSVLITRKQLCLYNIVLIPDKPVRCIARIDDQSAVGQQKVIINIVMIRANQNGIIGL